jgi:hypothetical protein
MSQHNRNIFSAEQTGPHTWRILDLSTGKLVGPAYRSLSDLRHDFHRWWKTTVRHKVGCNCRQGRAG